MIVLEQSNPSPASHGEEATHTAELNIVLEEALEPISILCVILMTVTHTKFYALYKYLQNYLQLNAVVFKI